MGRRPPAESWDVERVELAFVSELPRVLPTDALAEPWPTAIEHAVTTAQWYREALAVALAEIVTLKGYVAKLGQRRQEEWDRGDA